MNDYAFDEIEVGLEESFCIEITEQMQDAFLGMTNDVNPMHMDDDYARSAGFPGGRLVYGMLTASFISTLAGVYLPGKRCLLQECDVKFLRPVHIGDRLVIKGTVKDKDERFSRIKVQVAIRNQEDVAVLRASYYAGIMKRGGVGSPWVP